MALNYTVQGKLTLPIIAAHFLPEVPPASFIFPFFNFSMYKKMIDFRLRP